MENSEGSIQLYREHLKSPARLLTKPQRLSHAQNLVYRIERPEMMLSTTEVVELQSFLLRDYQKREAASEFNIDRSLEAFDPQSGRFGEVTNL